MSLCQCSWALFGPLNPSPFFEVPGFHCFEKKAYELTHSRLSHGGAPLIVAIFDFDGTMTKRDTLIPFLKYALGWWKFLWVALRSLADITKFMLGSLDRQTMKENLLRRSISGRSYDDLVRVGKEFAKTQIPRMVRQEGIDRLQWHIANEHKCMLVSASLDIYLEAWGGIHGFDGVICSRLAVSNNGTVNGRLVGRNCRGKEKLRRLYEQLRPGDISELYVYGDSAGDSDLLAVADHAFYRSFSKEVAWPI